jgi:hypothetical protein
LKNIKQFPGTRFAAGMPAMRLPIAIARSKLPSR